MKSVEPAGRRLLAVNVLLLGGLAVLSVVPSGATAQPGAGSRPRGEYTMVSGKTVMGSSHAVYVVDSSNKEMVVVRWDPSRKTLAGIGYRNLEADGLVPTPR